jgi:hypothetical protein
MPSDELEVDLLLGVVGVGVGVAFCVFVFCKTHKTNCVGFWRTLFKASHFLLLPFPVWR